MLKLRLQQAGCFRTIRTRSPHARCSSQDSETCKVSNFVHVVGCTILHSGAFKFKLILPKPASRRARRHILNATSLVAAGPANWVEHVPPTATIISLWRARDTRESQAVHKPLHRHVNDTQCCISIMASISTAMPRHTCEAAAANFSAHIAARAEPGRPV